MRYHAVSQGRFLDRPNRFIAHVELGGETVVCHVKNTGRCRELLVPGAAVYLEKSANPKRKTAYDLIAVEKGSLLVNMDAQAPNRVFAEWAAGGGFLPGLTGIRPESTWEDSRFDFLLEGGQGPCFVEVKGVTLEDGGAARFPDAPTERGVKHIREGRHPFPSQRRHPPRVRRSPAGGCVPRRGGVRQGLPRDAGEPGPGCAGTCIAGLGPA